MNDFNLLNLADELESFKKTECFQELPEFIQMEIDSMIKQLSIMYKKIHSLDYYIECDHGIECLINDLNSLNSA